MPHSSTISREHTTSPAAPVSSVISLASWRIRRTLFPLFLTLLGLLATVIVASSMPLFSTVMTTAGLRSVLRASPQSSQLDLRASTTSLTSPVVHALDTNFHATVQHNVGAYLQPTIRRDIHSYDFAFPGATHADGSQNPQLIIFATSITQAVSHFKLIQGRLPSTTGPGNTLEIMLTANTAGQLGVGLNSEISFVYNYYLNPPPALPKTVTLRARVVGIFDTGKESVSYWHSEDFNPQYFKQSSGATSTTITTDTFFVSDTALLNLIDTISHNKHIASTFSMYDDDIDWYYTLDPLKVDITQLNSLVSGLTSLQATISKLSNSSGAGFPYSSLSSVDIFSPLVNTINQAGTLERFRERVDTSRVPVALITIEVIALLLFIVSLLIDLLIECQIEVIAVLRSRGASRRQIFSALLLQCASLCLCAVILALLLVPSIVQEMAQHTLSVAQWDAIRVVTGMPIKAVFSIAWYALAVTVVALLTMSLSLLRATHMDALSIRHESARSTRVSLWQRLRLDVVFGIVALVGYLVSLYLTSIRGLLNVNTQAIISTPLTLIGPVFLVLALMLLLLRFFPRLLQMGAWIAARRRGATTILALAQMARSPRQPIRVVLLLALTLGFTLFSLVLLASQRQHASDVVAYETGADFSGIIPQHLYNLTPHNQIAPYLAIPGVISASAGYSGSGTIGNLNITSRAVQIRAVDTTTFANTIIQPDSTSSLDNLMSLLASQHSYGMTHDIVPVIVDNGTLRQLSLHVGSTFQLTLNSMLISNLNCLVVGSVAYIPTISNTLSDESSVVAQGGILADYQTYAGVYAQDVTRFIGKDEDVIPLNYMWLRTQSDATSLAHVRAALNSFPLQLDALQDRRTLLANALIDPLFSTLTGILTIGICAILVLASIGSLLASWLSVRKRLTNVAVLRALGLSIREVGVMLLWEQGCIYGAGLLLGILLGGVLSLTVVPSLLMNTRSADVNEGAFSALQSILPVRLVFPQSLSIAFIVEVMVLVGVISIMVYVVSQTVVSTSLRLNED